MGDKKWLKALQPEAAPVPAGEEPSNDKVTRDYQVEVAGKLFDVKVIGAAAAAPAAAAGAALKKPPRRERAAGGGGAAASGDDLISPLQGNVFKVPVEEGQEVSTGDLICVIEAMKMENEITAHKDGKITSPRQGGRVGQSRRRPREDRIAATSRRASPRRRGGS